MAAAYPHNLGVRGSNNALSSFQHLCIGSIMLNAEKDVADEDDDDNDDITVSFGTSHLVHCMLEEKLFGRCWWNDSTAASAPRSLAMLLAMAAALEAT